jgi:hypothetical protein
MAEQQPRQRPLRGRIPMPHQHFEISGVCVEQPTLLPSGYGRVISWGWPETAFSPSSLPPWGALEKTDAERFCTASKADIPADIGEDELKQEVKSKLDKADEHMEHLKILAQKLDDTLSVMTSIPLLPSPPSLCSHSSRVTSFLATAPDGVQQTVHWMQPLLVCPSKAGHLPADGSPCMSVVSGSPHPAGRGRKTTGGQRAVDFT